MPPFPRPPKAQKPYIPASETDIRKTFKRIRREIREQQEAEAKARQVFHKKIRSVA